MGQDAKCIRWFEEITIGDVSLLEARMPRWERCIANLHSKESESLSPDAVMKVTLNLLDVENKMSLLSQALQIANTRGVGTVPIPREMAVAQRS